MVVTKEAVYKAPGGHVESSCTLYIVRPLTGLATVRTLPFTAGTITITLA